MSDRHPPESAVRLPGPGRREGDFSCAREYAIDFDEGADSGLVIWARWGDGWHVNAGERGLVKVLLAQRDSARSALRETVRLLDGSPWKAPDDPARAIEKALKRLDDEDKDTLNWIICGIRQETKRQAAATSTAKEPT